jgi:aspartyl/asparaginyl beta-hydroxylase (cupin superfamily)
VRFLRLAAGSVIREHRDPGLRFEEGVFRLHIPVRTNPEVEFRVGGELLQMAEGECWYVNFDLPHALVNRGGSDRVHLVVDGVVDDAVLDWFGRP